MVTLVSLLLGVRFHAGLYPSSGTSGLGFELLFGHFELVEGSVRSRNVAALFESRTLQESEEPLLQVREVVDVDTGPFCRKRISIYTSLLTML